MNIINNTNRLWVESKFLKKILGYLSCKLFFRLDKEFFVFGPLQRNPRMTESWFVDSHIDQRMTRRHCQVFDQLFRYDGASSNIVPYAVESYEMDEDNMGITLNLRQDIIFHNGDKADADDLVFTFEHY